MAFLDQRLDIGHLIFGEGVVFLLLRTCPRVFQWSVVVEHLEHFSALQRAVKEHSTRSDSRQFYYSNSLSFTQCFLRNFAYVQLVLQIWRCTLRNTAQYFSVLFTNK